MQCCRALETVCQRCRAVRPAWQWLLLAARDPLKDLTLPGCLDDLPSAEGTGLSSKTSRGGRLECR